MSANAKTAAPTGRKKTAQGKDAAPAADAALGHDSPNTSSPEPERSGDRPPTGGPAGVTEGNQRAKLGGISNSSLGFDSLGNALPPSAITENELPTGWRWVRVREIGNVQLGRQRAPKHQNGAHMRPYLRVANVFEDRIDLSDVLTMNFTPREFETFALRPNDILLNEGQSLHLVGRPALYRDDLPGACFQNTLVRFRCGPEVEPRFALTIFRGYMHTGKFQKIARWTTNIAHLGAQRFAEMPFPLPPLPEQRRIVAEIEKQFTRLEAGVAALRRVQANLKRYRAAVLKAACEGQLVENEVRKAKEEGRSVETGEQLLMRILTERRRWFDTQQANAKTKRKYVEPAKPDSANLPELPDGWTWGTWNQISNWVTYGFTRPMPHVEQGIPIVTAKGVNNSRIIFDDAHVTTPEAYGELSEKDRPKPGDILITKDGTIGRAAVVDTDREFCINQSVAVIWLRSCPMERKYLLTVIESELTQKPIWAKARGVAIQHLSITDFAKLGLPIPPLAEQTRIVAEVERRLSVVEELESVVSANLQRATRLRQSILQKAFTGELLTSNH